MPARMLAEFFCLRPGFCSLLHRLYCARSLPTNIWGGNERSRIGGVRNYRNSCANQNRVHFVIFLRLHVRRGLEATTVWCETTTFTVVSAAGCCQFISGNLSQKPSPLSVPPNVMTICTGVYGEPPFWVLVNPLLSSPCRPLILKSLATSLSQRISYQWSPVTIVDAMNLQNIESMFEDFINLKQLRNNSIKNVLNILRGIIKPKIKEINTIIIIFNFRNCQYGWARRPACHSWMVYVQISRGQEMGQRITQNGC